MMNFDELHIHSLLVEKARGSLSPEMDAFLSQLIEDDAGIRQQWLDINQALQLDDPATMQRAGSIEWKSAEELMQRKTPTKRRIWVPFIRLAAAAAVLTGVAFGIYFWNRKGPQPTPSASVNEVVALSAARQQVKLRLANGQTINLSRPGDSVVAGSAFLHNTGKLLSYSIQNQSAAELSGINSLTVPIGKDYHLTLSDGTEVWLNSATRIDFSFVFQKKIREISITGEAYLKVSRDPARPFIVHTPRGSVQVLGTSFNINSYDSSLMNVALMEGSVKFRYLNDSVTIKPGMQATASEGRHIKISSFDEDEVLGWLNGMYYFTDVPLEDIIKVMPRWYGIHVVIDNKRLNRQMFTGGMDRNKPLSVFLDNLKRMIDIDYYIDDDGVLHFK